MRQEDAVKWSRGVVERTKQFFDSIRKSQPQNATQALNVSELLKRRVGQLGVEIERLKLKRLREDAKQRQIGFDF